MKQLFKLGLIAALPLLHIMCFAEGTATGTAAASTPQKINKPAEGAYQKLASCLAHARAISFYRISAQNTKRSGARFSDEDNLATALNPKIILNEDGQTYYISNEVLLSESGTHHNFPKEDYLSHLQTEPT